MGAEIKKMDDEGSSDCLSTERKVEIIVRKNGRKDEVIVEKSAAEGLPKGWIKKLIITNRRGRKVRRDSFFIDPKGEYVFQSFKGALRYVETGDIGIYARKLKESDIEDDDSGTGKNAFPLESVGKRSTGDFLEKEKRKNVHVKNKKRRYLSSSNKHSGNSKTSNLSTVTSQPLKDSGKKEQAKDPIQKQPMAKRITRSQAKACKNEDEADVKTKKLSSLVTKPEKDSVISRLRSSSSQAPEKESVMKQAGVQKSTVKWIMRSKAKVNTNELSNSVVRRASIRLASIVLEPMLELKTRTKAQRIVIPSEDGRAGKCKQPVNPVATSSLKMTDTPFNKELAKSDNEHSSPNKAVEMPVVISEVELNPVFHLDGYKQKEEMSPVSPLRCQNSATKCVRTATSKRLGQSRPKTKLMSSVKVTENSHLGSSNKGKRPYSPDSGNAIHKRNKLGKELSELTVVKGACSEVMEKSTNVLSSTFDSTLADLWKDPCIAFAIETLTGESLRLPSTAAISFDPKNNHTKQKGVSFSPETPKNVNTSSENIRFTTASSVADIWKDPCIDFAIRTLTGAIPVWLDEQGAKSKSEETNIGTTSMQEGQSRRKNCDYLIQQCNMKNKTVGKSADLMFRQS